MNPESKALLVIDMQKGSFTSATPRYDHEGVVNRINELADYCRKTEVPVFVIQHDGTGTGEFEKNTQEWENLDELNFEASDHFIDKYANDTFYQSELHAQLLELGIRELLITGCATDFCVASTIQAALSLDFNITVVANAHTTGNRPGLEAKQVIEHYNWVWSNMIPTEGKVSVKHLEELIS